ncbi:MAG: hypothetical protein J6K84_04420 [Oscillospiraceae bacterium]|nr:hypothetical protein [Oscillospiraceae bacterium]
MKRKLWEAMKTALIVLLTATFLLLTLMALPANIAEKLPLPNFLATFIGLEQEIQFRPAAENASSAGAVPILISVKNSAGRASIRQDDTALALAYDRFGDFLTEAFSTAEAPTQGADIASVLAKEGVLFSFAGKIPAEALGHWLGAQESQVEGVFGQYALVVENDFVALYAISGGRTVRHATAVSGEDFSARLQEYFPDGTRFAFEAGVTSVSPLTLWLDEVSLANYTAVSPLTADLTEDLATELNFNPYGSGFYLDPATGDRVYTEQDRNLTIHAGGSLLLTAKAGALSDFAAAGISPVEKIAAAEELIFSLCHTASMENPMVCGYEENGNMTTVSFCTILGGVPVYPHCGKVVFEDTEVVQLQATFRLYHKTGGFNTLMPIHNAAALAGDGAHIISAYQQTASSLVAGWQKQ